MAWSAPPRLRLAALLHAAAVAVVGGESDGFLSAAPTGAAAPLPDVSQTVGQRIAQDSKRIGLVAENLMGVQGDINRVEKEVLGKVFDLQSMKNFFSTHEAVVNENQKLSKEVSKMNEEIGGLSDQLADTRSESEQQDTLHHKKMAESQGKIAQDEATIQALSAELKKLKMLDVDNQKLQEVNSHLRDDDTKAVEAVTQAQDELGEKQKELQEHLQVTKTLQQQLIKQHQYAVACHGRVNSLEQHLQAAIEAEKAQKAQAEATVQQTEVGNMAQQNQLMSENAALKQRLEQAKQTTVAYQQQLSNTQGQMTALQHEADNELGIMRGEMDKMKQHLAVVENSLQTNIHTRLLVEKQLKDNKADVKKMQAALLDGKVASLLSANKQLEHDIGNMNAFLQASQMSQAKAEAQALHAKQLEAAWKATAEANARAAQEAAREALAQVAAAKKSDDKDKAAADEASMDAESVMIAQCGQLWDKKHKDILDKLEKCPQIKDDLNTAAAQVASLSSTVNAASSAAQAA